MLDLGDLGELGKLDRPVALNGVRDREDGPEVSPIFTFSDKPFPSPSRTKVSMDFSRFPPSPFKTAMFLFSSRNPISRNLAIFDSRSSSPTFTVAPNTLDCLFLGGDGDRSRLESSLKSDRVAAA